MSLKVVILAAGKGSRMKSAMPKVLHRIADKPMVEHVVDAAAALGAQSTVLVVGHGADLVRSAMQDRVEYVVQKEQLGTGHAVEQALPKLDATDTVLVAYGDVPLTRPETLQKLISDVTDSNLALLTVLLDDPNGYGRIVRDETGNVVGIVEQKDASDEQLNIREINTGILAARASVLSELLGRIDNNNAQQEYYLPDIFKLAVQQGMTVSTHHPEFEWETVGVNSRAQLAELERVHQRNQAEDLMAAGITLRDPDRIDIRGELVVGTDSVIDINCVFEGKVTLGENVTVGPNCHISNSTVASGTVIKPNTVIEDSVVGENCTLGPFARLRPGAALRKSAHIGNFVEIKKATIGRGSKVNHLSYVGDSTVGENVNIGAGTITCNYDGANKHQTVIEDGVFIGSCSQLIAPVKVEKNAVVGAGSTITRTVAENQLAFTRAPLKTVDNWPRPVKKPKSE
ncbi:UDP-N-acetylglucosamine diphosphorylase/glucosamine-1-phosphate N-acetyltransferase [Chromatiales bacterium (ex Bugula neritina AB1)]|nr:UDP-N-acetylglucosamine diphosphorylase/glucosamine-1-phosphate N-acetyltransferase [Chromatiales bacterium (ex Bugula neritina AB1)]